MENLADIMNEGLATREDMFLLRQELKQEIQEVHLELKQEVRDLELRLTIRFGTMLAAGVSIMIALQTFLIFKK